MYFWFITGFPLIRRTITSLMRGSPRQPFSSTRSRHYVNAAVLRGRPENLRVIGPLHWKAALYERPGLYGGKGRPPKKGRRLPTPQAMIEGETAYSAEVLKVAFPQGGPGTAGAGDP
jgi:hypothetical protein